MNLRTSGLKDPITAHGGCPVLVGSKWITNKWVIAMIKMMELTKIDHDDDGYGHVGCPVLVRSESITYIIVIIVNITG